MILSNMDYVPGKQVTTHFWIVNGSTVRSKNIWRDIMAWLKNIFGWELKWYTELLNEARQEAIERMIAEATDMWANAVLNIRFSTSSVSAGASELYVYGTAVKV